MCVSTQSTPVFGRNLPRLILKNDIPFLGRGCDGRGLDLGINEVQSDASLAGSTGFAAILAVRSTLVTLQMTFPASQTARPHSLRPRGSSIGGRTCRSGLWCSHWKGIDIGLIGHTCQRLLHFDPLRSPHACIFLVVAVNGRAFVLGLLSKQSGFGSSGRGV